MPPDMNEPRAITPGARTISTTTKQQDRQQFTPAQVWKAVMAAPLEEVARAIDPQFGLLQQGSFTCPICRPLRQFHRDSEKRPQAFLYGEDAWRCGGVDDGRVFNARRRQCDGGTDFMLRELVLHRRDALARFLEGPAEEVA